MSLTTGPGLDYMRFVQGREHLWPLIHCVVEGEQRLLTEGPTEDKT